jgi:uncharacterized damage-inducible protein DinB
VLPAVQPLFQTFQLTTTLFRNCLADVDDDVANARLTGNTNSLLFLAIHLVDERFYMLQVMGGVYNAPFPELANVKSIDQMPDDTPSVERVVALWDEITPKLETRFGTLTASDIEKESPFKFPPPDAPQNVLMGMSFLLHHEGYHLGQMALIRKGLGLPAMRYD